MSTRRLVECPRCGKKVRAEPLVKPLQALKSHLAACLGPSPSPVPVDG